MEIWNKMWEVWQESKVPSVQIRKFIIGEYHTNSPWFSKINNKQLSFSENPLNDTAYHLNFVLKESDAELIAGYKIFAYLKYNVSDNFWLPPLSYVMKKHNKALYDWWNSNARYILPDIIKGESFDFDFINRKKDWKRLTEISAQYWTLVAEQWEIIQLPNYMIDSEEFVAFEKYRQKINDEREYNQYLQLKNKFENH